MEMRRLALLIVSSLTILCGCKFVSGHGCRPLTLPELLGVDEESEREKAEEEKRKVELRAVQAENAQIVTGKYPTRMPYNDRVPEARRE